MCQCNLLNGSRAADHSPKSESVVPIEGQIPVVGDIPGNASGGATVTELERSCVDGCSSSTGVISKKHGCSSANLLNGSHAADHSLKSENVAPIKGQDAIVGDIPGDASGHATVTKLERTCTVGCPAGIGVRSS